MWVTVNRAAGSDADEAASQIVVGRRASKIVRCQINDGHRIVHAAHANRFVGSHFRSADLGREYDR